MADNLHTTDTTGVDTVWTDATLGANVTAGTAVAPGSRSELGGIRLRGQLAWDTQTFGSGTVLATLADASHWPVTRKSFSIRTAPTSNVSSVLHVNTDGTITNESTFGSTTSGYVSLDGMTYDLA